MIGPSTMGRAVPGRGQYARQALLAGAVFLALVALFGRIMGYDLRRDEFMFVPPAVLLDDYRLYQDLFYNHVPYSAWLFRAAHLLLPGLGLLAVARLTIFLAWILLLGGSAWLGWRLTRSALVAVFGPVSLMTADVLLGQAGMAATNNLLPLPFAMLGLGLLAISLVERDYAFARLFVAGLLLSVAAGMKASAIAFVPAVALGCFLLPRDLPFARRARDIALPVALGGVVGAAPLLWLAATQPDLFFAHIASYHGGPHVAYWRDNASSEPGIALGQGAKLQLAWVVWMAGAPLLALFVTALGGLFARGVDAGGAVLIVMAAMLSAALFAFLPTPGFPQYYIGPLICLPLLLALFWRGSGNARALLDPAMMVAVGLMLVIAAPRLALGLNELRHPDKLTVVRVQTGGNALRAALAQQGLLAAGQVATLSPLYPLAAGLPIYPEFAPGPFAMRVAPYTDAELRALYAMAGPDELPALFEAQPPAAIITGFDPGLDAALEAYAQSRGYQAQAFPAITDRYGEARLWLRPAAIPETDQTGGNP
ncbi:hypothetical protein [Paracoccus xiamenensis]|uniref:hypothetical protein n=1 Tax=Paracoccus xiamenensis TaxID=2714901 RepID=UPI0014097FE5|nr:hypothetical protein [Paracoccus xiamenensis]NHF73029.1 hypothetical protein [Paracoccus xiamenensis]